MCSLPLNGAFAVSLSSVCAFFFVWFVFSPPDRVPPCRSNALPCIDDLKWVRRNEGRAQVELHQHVSGLYSSAPELALQSPATVHVQGSGHAVPPDPLTRNITFPRSIPTIPNNSLHSWCYTWSSTRHSTIPNNSWDCPWHCPCLDPSWHFRSLLLVV